MKKGRGSEGHPKTDGKTHPVCKRDPLHKQVLISEK